MKKEINNYIKYALVILLVILAFIVVRPYITVIIGSLVLAFMAYPVHKWLRKYTKYDSISAILVTGLIILICIIPFLLLANVLLTEATNFYQNTDIEAIKDTISETLNFEIGEKTEQYIQETTQAGADYLLSKVSNFLLSIPNLIIKLVIVIFVLFYALRDGKQVLETVKKALPMSESHKKRILKKFDTTIKSLFYGEIAISLIEGIIASIGFYLLGVNSPLIWGILVGLVALLPAIGPTIVWGPMAIIYFLMGETTTAIGIAIFGLLILTILLDAVVRAKILGMQGHIHPIIILVGVLGGLAAFGVIGLIIGPLILVLLELTIEIYLEMKHEA